MPFIVLDVIIWLDVNVSDTNTPNVLEVGIVAVIYPDFPLGGFQNVS